MIIESPLGNIYTIANEQSLLLLDFSDSSELEKKIKKIEKLHNTKAEFGINPIINQVKMQLWEYFAGTRKIFDIPLAVYGTQFQEKSWAGLQVIPYSETRSYLEQATMIWHNKAVRAIWWANHHNNIVIIIPCHRVIGASGKLVWYGGGIERKIWLLEHEKRSKV